MASIMRGVSIKPRPFQYFRAVIGGLPSAAATFTVPKAATAEAALPKRKKCLAPPAEYEVDWPCDKQIDGCDHAINYATRVFFVPSLSIVTSQQSGRGVERP